MGAKGVVGLAGALIVVLVTFCPAFTSFLKPTAACC